MLQDLTQPQRQLANLMSDISERCYNAAWMANLEYVLWSAVLSGPTKYGHDVISQHDINQLMQLSEKANAWIVFHEDHEETSFPLEKWKEKFKKLCQKFLKTKRLPISLVTNQLKLIKRNSKNIWKR